VTTYRRRATCEGSQQREWYHEIRGNGRLTGKDRGGNGDLLLYLSQLKAEEICLDGKRYLARTELTGQADLAFKASGMRLPLHVTEMPRGFTDRKKGCWSFYALRAVSGRF